MSSILDILTKQLGGDTLRQISGQLGTDERTTNNAMSAALPMLLGALAKNTSQRGGAESLAGALDRDHDGGILENLSGLFGNPQAGAGDGIMRHMFGDRRRNVERNLSRGTGMSQDSMGKLFTMLAPVVMGALGQEKRRQGMDAGALAGFLGRERQEAERQAPREMGILGKLLDTDGDGDVDMGDIAKHGFGILGKLMNKR